MLSISVVEGDVLERPSELLILKYANGLHGVDRLVAQHVGFSDHVEAGQYVVVAGRRIGAKKVAFVGVGVLHQFRYAEIRTFGHDVLKIASAFDTPPKKITMPIHGPGYGLDESEAFLSLMAGIFEAIRSDDLPNGLKTIEIVERDPKRVIRLRKLLATVLEVRQSQDSLTVSTSKSDVGSSAGSILDIEKATDDLANYGTLSEQKIRLFVAMPFSDKYVDEFDIAITDAAQHANIVCERIDKEAYVGDIMNQVRKRIASYNGMLALLNDRNPNVFLEIGYAWAKEKPTVLIAKKGQKLPFDIGGQKCIVYSNISELRTSLKAELKALVDNGTLKAN